MPGARTAPDGRRFEMCCAEAGSGRVFWRAASARELRATDHLGDPIWHVGFNLEDEPPINEPDRSVHFYHLKYQPHMKADLIVEFPEDGHQLPIAPYSRERCFDPTNSVIVDRFG